jgi:prepilin-type N-terminal cleavage/methylation domain-containing protein
VTPASTVTDHPFRAALLRYRRTGFSLVELMVVLVIIGMMVTVAMVSWQYILPNQQFNTAIRNLSEHLADTRSKAIAFSRRFEIHYDLDTDEYWVVTPYRRDGGGFAVADDEERRIIYDTKLAESGIDLKTITIDDRDYHDGEVFVRFDPLGAGSGHRIVLDRMINDQPNPYTIEVLPLTGDIRVHEGILPKRIAEERDFD